MTRRGRPWRQVSRGTLVMGCGLFLLLNTTGNLPWSFWLRLLPLWPVCLIAIGLRLVFERSRLPVGILLSPVLVLGTMSWVAVAGPPSTSWDRGNLSLRAEKPGGIQRWSLEGNLAYGDLELASQPLPAGILVEGEATTGRGRPQLRTSSGRSLARVRFRQYEGHHISILGEKWSGWRLRLAEGLPLSLDLKLALAEGRFDLRTASLTAIDLDGAFNSLSLRLGKPERDVPIRLEGAFTGYHLQVPDGVPARVRAIASACAARSITWISSASMRGLSRPPPPLPPHRWSDSLFPHHRDPATG
ncbi:MAG: DUF5668 domain-containing protein [Acidobacteria bacterium]|nr:DUF5668 domain-containing protein [Acidobacteriota bacterium]